MTGTDVHELAGFAAGAIAVVVVVVVAVVWALTHPRRPHGGDANLELPGDLSPALVNLVTEGFEPTREAAGATVLDLAARRYLDIEEYGEDTILIRPRNPARPDTLSEFDQYVLEHIRSRVDDGVVPAEALAFSSDAAAKTWWKGLRRRVIRDARDRGLCRSRWPVWLRAFVGGATVACLALAYAFNRDNSTNTTLAEGVGYVSLVVVALLAAWLYRSDRQRETSDGLVEGGRWMGLRRALADSGTFADLPPGAVVLWDRYFAYAAGFGLAPLAVERLPLGLEDQHRAWSAITGQWRRIEVHYPRFRPGWGRQPVRAVAACLVKGAIAVALATVAVRIATDPEGTIGTMDSRVEHWVVVGATTVVVLAGAFAVLQAWVLLMALADLFAHHQVEGLAVRTRRLLCPSPDRTTFTSGWQGATENDSYRKRDRCFVAVDDGSAREVRALAVRRELFGGVHQGQKVRVDVTPRLRWVRSLEAIGPTPQPAAAAVAEPAQAVSDGSGTTGTLAQLAAALVASHADPGDPEPSSR